MNSKKVKVADQKKKKGGGFDITTDALRDYREKKGLNKPGTRPGSSGSGGGSGGNSGSNRAKAGK